MANFSHLTTPDNPKEYKGGYKDVVYFCPLADFDVIATPLGAPLALGDLVKISGDHAFVNTNGFFNWACLTDSVKISATTVGVKGARLPRWKAEFTLVGDTPEKQEQLERMLNTKGLLLLKESSCLVDDAYAQLGDECDTPDISWEYDSEDKAEGSKKYKVTAEVTAAKYYYTGAVVESTA